MMHGTTNIKKRTDWYLQVQAASFYTVSLVWCSHVIGHNNLCCDWSDCRWAGGPKTDRFL